jgi:ubiquitin-protein ligase E3 D
MATLTRPQVPAYGTLDILLNSSVPKPFPSEAERERILRDELLEELANEEISLSDKGAEEADGIQPEAPSIAHKDDLNDTTVSIFFTVYITLTNNPSNQHEIMPSIAYVQKSCLMTLNNLLSVPTKWHAIVPERRHSMPSATQPLSAPQSDVESPSVALQTLVSNLRNRESGEVMVESRISDDETALLHELRTRVEGLAPSLDSNDAVLASSLVSLLSHFNRLSVIQSTMPMSRPISTQISGSGEVAGTADVFDRLKRQLSTLQLERLAQPGNVAPTGSTPVLVVETALLWSRIDADLENVVSMCKERTEALPRFSMSEHLPPQYDHVDHAFDTPPEYEHCKSQPSIDSDAKSRSGLLSTNTVAGSNEKMRLDLDAVAMAIDRLYRVAPQLHDQRVELKTSKVEQMEKARQAGVTSSRPSSKGKEKERDVGELENIFDMLGKASARKISDQSFVLNGGMSTQLEKARRRNHQKVRVASLRSSTCI